MAEERAVELAGGRLEVAASRAAARAEEAKVVARAAVARVVAVKGVAARAAARAAVATVAAARVAVGKGAVKGTEEAAGSSEAQRCNCKRTRSLAPLGRRAVSRRCEA